MNWSAGGLSEQAVTVQTWTSTQRRILPDSLRADAGVTVDRVGVLRSYRVRGHRVHEDDRADCLVESLSGDRDRGPAGVSRTGKATAGGQRAGDNWHAGIGHRGRR
jgi:hypothetical protein